MLQVFIYLIIFFHLYGINNLFLLTGYMIYIPITDSGTKQLQVLMRVEQEQKATEEARILAEKDAAAQRYAVVVIQVLSHL